MSIATGTRPADEPLQRVRARSYTIAIAVLLVLIVYGSLYPLEWDFDHPQDFIFLGPVGLGDLLENIVLFFPLGWLLAWHHHARRSPVRAFVVWFVIALVVAAVLQWLQKYLPRVPALSDVVFNMVGHVAGWFAGLVCAHALDFGCRRHAGLRSADRFALLMVGLWWMAELFPFVPSWHVSEVLQHLQALADPDGWTWRRMALHVGTSAIGLEALSRLMRSAALPNQSRQLAWLAACAVLAGKFVVVHQSPSLAAVTGIAGGALLWRSADGMRERPAAALWLAVALGSYLVHEVWPLQLREPMPMAWLPFASALSSDTEAGITSISFECLCFAAMAASALRLGLRWSLVALGAALLAFAGEWTQRYLPSRTPEITSVVSAIGMAWLAVALELPAER